MFSLVVISFLLFFIGFHYYLVGPFSGFSFMIVVFIVFLCCSFYCSFAVLWLSLLLFVIGFLCFFLLLFFGFHVLCIGFQWFLAAF